MTPVAVEQAADRLERAETAAEHLKNAKSYKEAERAWEDFLSAVSTLYNKLEQGAKSSNASANWFGKRKHERRVDPLLRYLKFARNSDEHGVEYVTSRVPGGAGFDNKPLPFGQHIDAYFTIHETEDSPPKGEPILGRLHGPTIKMVRAHDRRFNDFCDPPEEHLGEKLVSFGHPVDVIPAALTYLKSMIAEAQTLVGR